MTKSLLAAALLLAASSSAVADDVWAQYNKLANKINSQVEKAAFADIKQNAIELTRLSTKLLPAFVEKQPVCKEYIQAAMAASERMMTISLEEIESDYHADGKLPPMKQAVCYHAKDLLVHPATVAVIAQTQLDNKQTRKQLHHEIEEVLEHFNEVKRNAGR